MVKSFYTKRKFLLFSGLIISLSLFIILPSFAQSPTQQGSAFAGASSVVSIIKDLVNILFFLIIGTLGLLSYLQARKTLFTPIKTETFKLQLKTFEEILLYFDHNDPDSLYGSFDFPRVLYLNSSLLICDYVDRFFPGQWDIKEKRKKITRENPSVRVKLDDCLDWEVVDSHVIEEKEQNEPQITNPAVILAKWQKYKYVTVHYSEKCYQQFERLKKFRTSPLVPAKLRELIRELEGEAYDNLEHINSVLTEVAKDLPEKYPSIEEVKKLQFFWINNKYRDKRSLMNKTAVKILDFINDYLNIEGLLRK